MGTNIWARSFRGAAGVLIPALTLLSPLLLATCRSAAEVPPPPPAAEAGLLAAPGGRLDVLYIPAPLDGRRPAQVLNRMSLEQRIGQRFIGWVRGTEISEPTRRLIREAQVGGVILYPWNVETRAQVRELTASLQAAAMQNEPAVRLFICADQEGGRVAAFRLAQTARLQAPYYWAEHGDPNYILAASYITACDLRSLGCNMNFAPVLDLYDRPDSTIIGDRSMGADPLRIGRFAVSYLRGARMAGVVSVIKHFPGHGSSTVDSHGRLPVVDLATRDLMERDFKPFRMAIDDGAEALMTAHILFPRLDPRLPVTLSPAILRNLLRRRFGFSGVVISDGLSMGAIAGSFPLRETLKLLFQAGVDLILVHDRYDVFELKREVLALLEEGSIREEWIDEGVRRVLELKNRYGLLPACP